jgi:hypothetical protein
MRPSFLSKKPSENVIDILLTINTWIYGIYLTLHLFGKELNITWINIILAIFFVICDAVYIYMTLFHWSKIEPDDKWYVVFFTIMNIIFILQYFVW